MLSDEEVIKIFLFYISLVIIIIMLSMFPYNFFFYRTNAQYNLELKSLSIISHIPTGSVSKNLLKTEGVH